VTQFLISLFNVSDPGEARGNSLTAREVLDNGAQQLARTLRDQALVRARLGTTIGTVYTNLGLYASAQPLLEQALELARAGGGDDNPQAIAALDALAAVIWYRGDYRRLAELYAQVVEARRRTLGDGNRVTLKAQYDLSSAYQGAGRRDEAERLLRATLERQRVGFGDDDLDTLAS
jgi:tetratricopeptide (TPR) repeat protein